MHTNKDVLAKGIKYLGYTVLLMFLAPTVLYQAFKNIENTLFIPVLIVGGLLAIGAIVLAFKGVNTIMKSMFGDKKK
ncbi:DUF6095 family protein [Cellulophaga tyrosinoxydans]|uniref:Uncharacterized protein n=1 Tax=Cellulophaga tyrosinoxydans TaxID=504486 RepID=A0A1W2BUN5_9FLAO|nr:DUF6095 family protein [Cellulophaga tyrosinoxydans]SMC76436.1 hypothetical protein SAMN05660703_2702 [Cellulophaga tyrosinoxydans]